MFGYQSRAADFPLSLSFLHQLSRAKESAKRTKFIGKQRHASPPLMRNLSGLAFMGLPRLSFLMIWVCNKINGPTRKCTGFGDDAKLGRDLVVENYWFILQQINGATDTGKSQHPEDRSPPSHGACA